MYTIQALNFQFRDTGVAHVENCWTFQVFNFLGLTCSLNRKPRDAARGRHCSTCLTVGKACTTTCCLPTGVLIDCVTLSS